ncbi:hypothetical protein GUJ93_ZPchr0008g13814 [Zizania palustris]|uniref:Uncharacterized protein n=1 Tax=Zizania palustris TaxID=103762 RepID=A0A8J5RUS1_ZIZPA|nr:hypothetical protein GUJ93_ZPchr0008g13814 [Zizania palustris]
MAQPGLLLLLLLFLFLFARVDAAVSAAAAAGNPARLGGRQGEVVIAVEEAAAGQLQAAAEPGRPEMAEMEVISDYPNIGPNKRHNPHP